MRNFAKTGLSGFLASILLFGCGGSDNDNNDNELGNDFQSFVLKDSLEYSTSGLTKVISPLEAGSTSVRIKINPEETTPSFIFLEQYAASKGFHIAKVKITPSGESSKLSFEYGENSKDSHIVIPNGEWVDLSLAWDVENNDLTLAAQSGDSYLGDYTDTLGSPRAVQVVRLGHGEEGSVSSTEDPLKIDSFEIFNSETIAVYSESFDKTSDFKSFGSWGDNKISSDSSGYTPAEVLDSGSTYLSGAELSSALPDKSNSVRLVNLSGGDAAHARFNLTQPMSSGTFSVDLNPDSMDSTEIFVFLATKNGSYEDSVSYIKLRPEYYGTRVENVLYNTNGKTIHNDTGFQIPHAEWRTLQLSWNVDENNLDITLLDEQGNSSPTFKSELVNQVPVDLFDIKVGLESETTQEGVGLLVDNYRVVDSNGNTIVDEGFHSGSPSLPPSPPVNDYGDWSFEYAEIDSQDSSTPIDVEPLDPAKLIDLNSENQQYVEITDFMTDDAGEIRSSVYGGSHLGTISYKLFYPIEETGRYKLVLASSTTATEYNVNSFTFDDGIIKDSENVELGSFDKGKWLDISVEYDREKATIFIDGVKVGTAKNTSDNKLYYVRIISGSTDGTTDVGIYVDDLNIVTDAGRWIFDNFESYEVGTMLTPYNSSFLKDTISAEILEGDLKE
ncbi:hypothetical protein [Vibrio comitans]|uniref:Uncharacterized protein n=1 Tax=Vibrio comitans NBRC 102076 TaxID=1219078 RepID=A0A4Y3IRM2_9VIBR|nr:hypothetical protein [Vibrio comitans]GEA61534.1 hypothetical protein VCO01S_27270 [Vibrio comitans NBRC 102076]